MLLFPSNLLKFRYADLKNNRLTDYTFSFDKMLSDKVPSCTLISFDLIKNHYLSIWMMITPHDSISREIQLSTFSMRMLVSVPLSGKPTRILKS